MSSAQFVCEDFNSVSCESSWEIERKSQDAGSQTSSVEYADNENQTFSVKDAAVQAHKDTSTNVVNVDYDKLATWLTRITPHVLNELDNLSRSRAFYGYKLQESNYEAQMKLLYTLDCTFNRPEGFVSSVAWSSTGGVIAVSFCVPRHSSWCDHTGHIALYQVNRQDFCSNLPNRKLELNACVTVMSAHPSEPYILACGTFSGEVIVWNLQREEPVVLGNSTLQSESIMHMEWVHGLDATQTKPFLATSSQDGTVLIWNVKIGSSSLMPVKSFLLQSEKVDMDLGVACVTFHPKDSHQFLAGVDGGAVLLCSTESKRPVSQKREKQNLDGLDLYDPIVATLDGHKGAVTGVLWTSNDNDKVLSCGTDSELHIYSVDQIIHLAEPCLGMTICLPQPHLVAIWGPSRSIALFNIFQRKEVMSLALCAPERSVPLSVIRFQGASSFVVAAGDNDGQVHVWQVPIDKILEEAV